MFMTPEDVDLLLLIYVLLALVCFIIIPICIYLIWVWFNKRYKPTKKDWDEYYENEKKN